MFILCASEYQYRIMNNKTYSSKIPKLKQRNKKFFGHLEKAVVYNILG